MLRPVRCDQQRVRLLVILATIDIVRTMASGAVLVGVHRLAAARRRGEREDGPGERHKPLLDRRRATSPSQTETIAHNREEPS
jgi:hypothetical protein